MHTSVYHTLVYIDDITWPYHVQLYVPTQTLVDALFLSLDGFLQHRWTRTSSPGRLAVASSISSCAAAVRRTLRYTAYVYYVAI